MNGGGRGGVSNRGTRATRAGTANRGIANEDWGDTGVGQRNNQAVCAGRPAGYSDEDGSDSDDYYGGGSSGYNACSNGPNTTQPYVKPKVDILPVEELRIACVNDDMDKVLEILNEGRVTVDESSKTTGWSPLMVASSYSLVPLVKLLLERGANVNYKATGTGDGLTPLMTCSLSTLTDAEKVVECAMLLIEKGADVNNSDNNGMVPLMFAAKENKITVARLLLDNGAEVDRVDRDGRSALEFAAGLGHGKVVRLLLERDANVLLINEGGQTASEIASENGHHKISDILYRVETTKWRPGLDPSLINELADVTKVKTPYVSSSVKIMQFHERSQIEMVLENLNLKDYIKNFEEHEIAYSNFLTLSDTELKDIGIKVVGVRMKILDAIRNIHNREWVDKSIEPIYLKSNITAPEVICILNNTKKHIEYIAQSVKYLRIKSVKNPEMLEVGIEESPINQILKYAKLSLQSINNLQSEVKLLQTVLKNMETNAECQTPDEVTSAKIRKYGIHRSLVKWTAGVVSVVGLYYIVKYRPRLVIPAFVQSLNVD